MDFFLRSSIFCLVLLVTALHISSGSPFLYNAPRAIFSLISSASASASSPQSSAERMSHIADLRQSKALKAEQLMTDKQTDAQDPDSIAIDAEFPGGDGQSPDNTNEVLPGIITKKISKILAKIQFISSLSNYPAGNPDDGVQIPDFEVDFDNNNSTEENITDNSPTESQQLDQLKSSGSRLGLGYFYSKPDEDELRFSFEESFPDEEDGELQGDNFEKKENDLTKSAAKKKVKKAALQEQEGSGSGGSFPQNIAMYFLELLASMFGLAYGAAAQSQRPH